jgi:hypothetical protein
MTTKEKQRKYVKANDGKFVEVGGGKNGHFTSVRKIMCDGTRRRYGWIHGSRCLFCGMKDEGRNFSKTKFPNRKKITKSTDDLMSLRLKPALSMGGMLERWS